jgi:hypothetical protein
VILAEAKGRRIEAFRVFDVSTENGWAAGRRQREKWGRDRSAVIWLDLDRVRIVLFADEASSEAAA